MYNCSLVRKTSPDDNNSDCTVSVAIGSGVIKSDGVNNITKTTIIRTGIIIRDFDVFDFANNCMIN
jgi:hypothetical protein